MLQRRRRHSRQSNLVAESLERRTLLTQFVVNTLNDTVAVDLVTGTDANGAISLRSAVMAANSQIGPHTIVLSPTESNAPYLLTITGRNEDAAASGDLDLKGRITIEGHGATIDANSIDRVFETLGGANITLKNLNLDQGEALEGGVI